MADTEPHAQTLAGVTGALLLVGAGKMGGALLQGWLRLGLAPTQAGVIEPQPSQEIVALASRGLRLNPEDAPVPPAAVVIAVKPQTASEVVGGIANTVGPETLVVSIMAGKTLRFLEDLLPPGCAVVRAMPNTPAAIGRGITVAVANARVSPTQRDLAHRLLAATGAVEWIADEALMDPVTAVSGSGPAYVFLLTEALAQAGVTAGLPPRLAARLARETVAGSAALMQQSEADPALLRQNVTSPGGTTAAALEVLMSLQGLGSLMNRAVAAAARRSRELAG